MLKKAALVALAVSTLGGCGSAPVWSNAYGYDNATFRTIVVSPAGEVFIGYNFGQTKSFERLPAVLERPGGGSGPRAFQVSEQGGRYLITDNEGNAWFSDNLAERKFNKVSLPSKP